MGGSEWFGLRFHIFLQFFFPFKYNEKQNTFESVHHVKYCQQFEQYIENLKAHLVHDIEINDARVARKLKDEILKTLNKPKAEILYMLVNFDDFTFEAYQVMFHLLSPNEIFYKQYDQLFLDHYILQLQKRQGESFQILQTDILKIEPFTLTFENNIDFSTIKSFNYISKNIFQLDLKHAAALNAMEETDPINYTKPPPVTVFKTKNRGWGVKSIGMIDRCKLPALTFCKTTFYHFRYFHLRMCRRGSHR